ncbi:MAG TPA: bifunctional 5,10-methylenetetrahydrofolate dehydrogenase/5,10-methenyltetrahydrofolate cyclohydrolase [Gaiellales bacterium]|nr:bifunctional 5,10-methylenetetrahydrofolate dehydrogenase/5,10-methenyltetrahydrofolate cyclohydrolase [Gaiellales bacterium]
MLIDGKAYAAELAATLRDEVARLPSGAGIATLLVGDDLAAQVYQRRIDRHAQEAGLASRPEQLPADATLGQVVGKLAELDVDPEITGILVLRPLPSHLPESRVFAALPPLKDVEALHPVNAGLLSLGMPRFVPSTPASAFHMLDRYTAAAGRDPATAYDGLNLALVGRSNNVGKPAAILGLQRNATVISCHKHTFDAGRLAEHTRGADILIVAVGVPGLITGEMVRPGALVIDIGINALEAADGTVTLVGDVHTDSVEPVAEAVSPVPGGVGPITDIWVLRNTVTAAWLQTTPPAHA